MFRNAFPYLIQSTMPKEILAQLKNLNVAKAHFTNGTYMLGTDITVATTLAGFRYALTDSEPFLPLIIAINSDASLRSMGKTHFKDQTTRANDIAKPLAETFPNNKIIIIFYDEATPTQLYELLAQQHITYSLHKWGYGTDQYAPKIEGAQYFNVVYGYPLVDDLKPVCWKDTPCLSQSNIKIVDLRGELITAQRKCLFELPESLKQYQDDSCKLLPKKPGAQV